MPISVSQESAGGTSHSRLSPCESKKAIRMNRLTLGIKYRTRRALVNMDVTAFCWRV